MQRAPDRESEGFFAGLVQKYDSVWQTLILPERMAYLKESLGPETRRLDKDTVFQRIDDSCSNVRGEKIEMSFFQLQTGDTRGRKQGDTCLLYLHSHGGNRLEGLSLLRHAGTLGINLCCFDFAGSGLSEGKYTTLGLRESEDCRVVVETLMRNYSQKQFVLWGRSMGAVAAILYAAGKQSHIKSMVLDSPFSDVEQMVRDAGNSYMSLGEYLAMFLFSMVKNDIKQHIGQDLSTFQPIKFCQLCEAPCVFMVGKGDPLVPPERVQQMCDAYKGTPKEFMVIEGSHSSSRQMSDVELVFSKVASHLKLAVKPMKPSLDMVEDPKVKYRNIIVDKFGEIDTMISQKRLEINSRANVLQPKSRNSENQISQTRPEDLHNDPKTTRDLHRISKISRFQPIKPKTEIPFSVAPPRYMDAPQLGPSRRLDDLQLKNYLKGDSTRDPFLQPQMSSPIKAVNYPLQNDQQFNKENIQMASNKSNSKTKINPEPRKSSTYIPHSLIQPTQSIQNYNRPLMHSDRSNSKSNIFSTTLQNNHFRGYQPQVHSPVVQTNSTLKGVTHISPFQISPASQKESLHDMARRMSRPSSPIVPNMPANRVQEFHDSTQTTAHMLVPQEGNLISHHLHTGQLKAALQSRLKEKPAGQSYHNNFGSFQAKPEVPAKLLRNDSFHEQVSLSGGQAFRTQADRTQFERHRKSIRQVKIFDDVEDSPDEYPSISLLSHTVSITPSQVAANNGRPRPPSYSHLAASFR